MAFPLFSESYRISDVTYTLDNTREMDLRRVVPVNTEKIFDSKEELDFYLSDLKQRLMNTRAFQNVEISNEVGNGSGTAFTENRSKLASQVFP